MKFKQTGILVFSAFIFNACNYQPPLPQVNEEEVLKLEKSYLKEYKQIQKNYKDTSTTKWIQASNKKEPCKLFVGFNKNNDRTLKED